MARIRTVKPSLFRHKDLYDAEVKSGLPLRLAFIGLFTVADREGRFRWKPEEIQLDVLPYDRKTDMAAVLETLAKHQFITKYEQDDQVFGCFPTWREHQVINHREMASNLPKPSDINKLPTRAPRDTVMPSTCSAMPGGNMEYGIWNMEYGTRGDRSDLDDSVAPSPLKLLPKTLPKLAEVWNKHADPIFPRVMKCGSRRNAAALARWKENGSEEFWVSVISKINASDFCRGKNNRSWMADFDFLVNVETANKALEGKYDNRSAATTSMPDLSDIFGKAK